MHVTTCSFSAPVLCVVPFIVNSTLTNCLVDCVMVPCMKTRVTFFNCSGGFAMQTEVSINTKTDLNTSLHIYFEGSSRCVFVTSMLLIFFYNLYLAVPSFRFCPSNWKDQKEASRSQTTQVAQGKIHTIYHVTVYTIDITAHITSHTFHLLYQNSHRYKCQIWWKLSSIYKIDLSVKVLFYLTQ